RKGYMPRKSWVVGGIVLVVGLAAVQGCKTPPGKPIALKVLVPHDDAKVLVDGKLMDGKGGERTITTTTEAGQDHVVVTATWEPNNYTTITRPRKIAWQDGTITVDLRKPSDAE